MVRQLSFILLILTQIALADPAEFRTFEQAPQIGDIARKYLSKSPNIDNRTPASVSKPELAKPDALNDIKQNVQVWFHKTNKDRVAKFISDNFFPELKGTEQMAFGDMVTPASAQVIEMQTAAARFARIWEYRQALIEGGTLPAGQTAAKLIRKFAARKDLYEVSKETDSTPYEDLKIDIGRLSPRLAYRMSWALGKLGEFHNPQGVRWTPNAYFQLGKENSAFIQGFMREQFSKKSAKRENYSAVQSGVYPR